MKRTVITLFGCVLLFAGVIRADQMTAAFPDPSRPGAVKIMNGNGQIKVEGYDGDEVIVESIGEEFPEPQEENERARGLRRIGGTSISVTTNDEANAVEVTRSWNNNVDLYIQVPVNTSVYSTGALSGDITITGVTGQIEVKTLDGSITLDRVSGSVVANTLDGEILAIIDQVKPKMPLSFTTLDGDVDVTLPADIAASVKLSTMDGDIYTDFDIKKDTAGDAREQEKALKEMQKEQQEAARKEQQARSEDNNTGVTVPVPLPEFLGGGFNLRIPGLPQTTFYGIVNGGGQYLQISTMDGDIYLRKNQ